MPQVTTPVVRHKAGRGHVDLGRLQRDRFRELAHGWRSLALPDLEDLLLRLRRLAVHQHFGPQEWALVDRIRVRIAAWRAEAA
jgi:hypothetical protein